MVDNINRFLKALHKLSRETAEEPSIDRVAQELGITKEEWVKRDIQRIPLGRYATEEEVVGAALFLVSDKTSSITGVALPIDGGFLAV